MNRPAADTMAGHSEALFNYFTTLLQAGFRFGALSRPHGKYAPPKGWNKDGLYEDAPFWLDETDACIAQIQAGRNLFVDIPKGYWVLDVDAPKGLKLMTEISGLKVEESFVVGTPSGGYHFYFAGKGLPQSSSNLGLDIREHRKGYVVAAGSWRPASDPLDGVKDGQDYRYDGFYVPLERATELELMERAVPKEPEFLTRRIQNALSRHEESAQTSQDYGGRDFRDRFQKIPRGSRHAWICQEMGAAARTLRDWDAYAKRYRFLVARCEGNYAAEHPNESVNSFRKFWEDARREEAENYEREKAREEAEGAEEEKKEHGGKRKGAGRPRKQRPTAPPQLTFDIIDANTWKKATKAVNLAHAWRYDDRGKKLRYQKEEGGEWVKTDEATLTWMKKELERQCFLALSKVEAIPLKFSVNEMTDMVQEIAYTDPFDPFLEWLESVPEWDGERRICGLLTDMFGAKDNPLTKWSSKYLFLAPIQRALEPGCLLRECPILIGEQRQGKGSLFAGLLPDPEWFTDDFSFELKEKERIENTLGKVLVEMAELIAFTKKDVAVTKAYMSRRVDRTRLAYRRDTEDIPRRFAIVRLI